jgi:Cu(I)/Ag(I) efflux system membrane protein CusA/SilA
LCHPQEAGHDITDFCENRPDPRMVNWLVALSLRHRVLVIGLAFGLAGWGAWAATATPIDAIPDLSDNQVIVFTDWTGHSAQEVEDQVSYPLTVNLKGLAGVRVVRSQSAFGFSMIYVVFEDNVDQYFARSRVLERLSLLSAQMPGGAVPTLGPDATGVGHVFWYTVESDRHSLRDLRSLQDWFIRYQLNAVPGVAEVASVGGHVQQYQFDIDPTRLRAYNLSLGAVVEAATSSKRMAPGRSSAASDSSNRSTTSNRSSSAHPAACPSTCASSGRCTSATPSAWRRWSRDETRPWAA